MALQVVGEAKVQYSYGPQETVVATRIRATVMAIQIAYLLYQYLVLHKEDLSLGIWKNAHRPWLPLIAREPLGMIKA